MMEAQTHEARARKEALLLNLLHLKAEKDRTRLQRFAPNPGFQEAFFKSVAPIQGAFAGNQSGKTHCGAAKHAHFALGTYQYAKVRTPNVGVVVTAKPLKEGLEKDIVPKFLEVCGSRDFQIQNNPQGIPTKLNWRNGSVSYLMSAEQEDIVFEGTPFDHAWLDEPSRRSIFIGIKRGFLTTGGIIWMTCTLLEEPWIFDEIYLPGLEKRDPAIEIFEGSSDENIKISEKQRDEFRKRLTEDEIQTRWYGKPQHLSGRVFKGYKAEVHRVPSFDVPPHWPVWCAIDPHPNKPHAALFLAVSPQGFKYVVNEIYQKCPIYTFADYVNDVGSQYNLVNILIDTSAQEDGWGKVSARAMLEEKGVRTKLAQKKNLKKSGIVLVNQLFQDNELFVMEHCVRTHRELVNQIYKKNKLDPQKVLEEPEKKFDDMTDCLRYILVEAPDYAGIASIKEMGPVYERR